jgi:hypothetical protein
MFAQCSVQLRFMWGAFNAASQYQADQTIVALSFLDLSRHKPAGALSFISSQRFGNKPPCCHQIISSKLE